MTRGSFDMGQQPEAPPFVKLHEFSQCNFWTRRLNRGPAKIFSGPEELLEAADEYFTWCNNHPLKSQVVFHHKGELTYGDVGKMRSFTISGMCTYIGISTGTYERYRKDPEMREAIALLDDIIRTQKFEAAAADLLNANLIARDLGISEKTEITGKNGEPVTVINRSMTVEEAAAQYASMVHSDAGQPEA